MVFQVEDTLLCVIKGGESMLCMICDDQKSELEAMQEIVSEYDREHPDLFLSVRCFSNPFDMLDEMDRCGAPDIALLDICLLYTSIWDALYAKIGNPYGVAGLMGNLYAESGLRPDNLQDSYEASLGYTDASYTSAVDSGEYANFATDSAGYGLAQWTAQDRKESLLAYKNEHGASIADLDMQLAFLCHELETKFPNVLGAFFARSPERAVSVVYVVQIRRADGEEGVGAGGHQPARLDVYKRQIQTYFHIVFPLLRPTMISAAILEGRSRGKTIWK